MAILHSLPPSDPAFGLKSLSEPGTILLESQRRDRENTTSFLLARPVEVLECRRADQVAGCLGRAQELLECGLALAGFLSYEAGAALQPPLPATTPGDFPLVWLAAYERVSACQEPLELPPGEAEPAPVRGLRLDMDRADYCRAVEAARRYIAAGDNYQTNLTCRLHFDSPEEPLAAYLRLRLAQPVPYGAFLNCGDFQVISQSPELFLRRRGFWLETRPMKGTSARGRSSAEDEGRARALARDAKCRAENIMIVDLMRNDLGRLATYGTVAVFDLFRVERYNTLLQMTSGVRCRLRPGLSLLDILAATFPPGSVTGAPKYRTMEIIGELEGGPRKVYTGAIGLFLPGGDMVLNVAIRTLIASGGHYEMGIGSGIVADSRASDEYEETRLKSRFFFAPARQFRLLETIRCEAGGGFASLEAHLRRLRRSARYFGYPFSRRRALEALEAPAGLGAPLHRVRLLLDRHGRFEAEWEPLGPLPPEVEVLLSRHQTRPSQPWLYHKTTERHLYDRELALARRQGFGEVLFTNSEGQLTEGAFTNLMVRAEGRWVTPKLSCGLLPGIWRSQFIRRHHAGQAILTPADLPGAEEVLLGNSVRGSLRVSRITDTSGRVLFQAKPAAVAVAG
jgi:para-aminobenzoate synthetase/4-amino-4-deoxychorismate lyase